MVSKVLLAALVVSLAYVTEAVYFRNRFPGKTLSDLADCQKNSAITGATSSEDFIYYGTANAKACPKYCLKRKASGERKNIESRKNINAAYYRLDTTKNKWVCTCYMGGSPSFTNEAGSFACTVKQPEEEKPSRCPVIDQIANAQPMICAKMTTTIGSPCNLICNDGFELDGNGMVYCGADGVVDAASFGTCKQKKPEWPCIANDPCQNGAKCINVGKADGSRGYECECKVGWEGTDCDKVKASPGQWCIDALKSSSIPNKNKADFDKVAWNDGYVYFYTARGYEFRDAENRCEQDYGELAWAGMDSLETREKIITLLGQDDQEWGTAWFGLTLENGKWQYGNGDSDQFHWDSWSIKGADMTPGNVGTLTIHKGKDDNLKSSYWGRENAAYNNALCQISCSFFED